jgi:hypothetical protein
MSDSIPDFLKLSSVPINYLQQLETDLLEPVVFNDGSGSTVDGFCRFTLQNKGFLHSHSKLFLSLVPGTGVTRAIFPPNVGIGSVISRAVLKIGNKVLNEITDWDYLHAMQSTKISNENNVERELYTTGRYLNHAFNYTPGLDQNASTYGISVGRDAGAVVGGANATMKMLPFAIMDVTTVAESPSYAIDLSDLFPFLKVHSLPLYICDEPINIELTFRPPESHRVCKITGAAGAAFVIDQNELKFCADYIYYGAGDEMERFAQQNKSMSFSFVDYRGITTTTTQAALQSTVIRNIGMASRQVNKVITSIGIDRLGEDELLLQLGGQSTLVEGAGDGVGATGSIEYNIRYNDRFEFSSNVTNTARLFSLLQDAEGVCFVTRDEYSGQGGGLSPDLAFETFDQETQLQGEFFFNSTKLTGGRVGQRGIELHLTETDSKAAVTTMRNWCEYMRVATLEDGIMNIYNV